MECCNIVQIPKIFSFKFYGTVEIVATFVNLIMNQQIVATLIKVAFMALLLNQLSNILFECLII